MIVTVAEEYRISAMGYIALLTVFAYPLVKLEVRVLAWAWVVGGRFSRVMTNPDRMKTRFMPFLMKRFSVFSHLPHSSWFSPSGLSGGGGGGQVRFSAPERLIFQIA